MTLKQDVTDIIQRLENVADERRLEGMGRFGIDISRALGVSIPLLRNEARNCRKGANSVERHSLALALWDAGIHETRILASMVDSPGEVGEGQLEAWARDFNSWDLCDQCCNNLFRHTSHAWNKAMEWGALGARGPEFSVRAGFVLMATLAVGDKRSPDERFLEFFPLLRRGCADGRNYVKKAVSWALRQMGKRSSALHAPTVELANWMREQDTPSARWIGADALRDIERPEILERLGLR